MTNLLPYAALVGALFATPVSGTVLFDGGFDASTFSAKFDIVSYGSPFGVSVAGGTASIEKLPTPGGVSGVTYIIPRLAVTGDFRQDVTFDFSSTVDPYQAVSILQGLSVNFGGVENSDQLGAYINRDGIGELGYNFIVNDVAQQFRLHGIYHITDMRLRIERRGDTVQTFVGYGSNSYSLFDTVSDENFLRPATFYLSLNAFASTVLGSTARFSDFSVSTVPEPSLWAALIVGFAFCGSRLRSQRRQSETEAYLSS